ncbi:MAG: hypothetical protein PF485_09150 [Bacteroidales bacterium]|jgi:hypothetical protein|nr:hypothetical protein [Bacteroidales bacterium]
MKNNEARLAFYSIKENKPLNEIIDNLSSFNNYLINLYNKKYPRKPKNRDVYQRIFIQANHLKNHKSFLKNNLIAAQWTIERVISNIQDFQLNKSLKRLIKDIICDLQPIIKYHDPEHDFTWLLGNTNVHISNFYHNLSYHIFWTGFPSSEDNAVVLSSSAPFLIRQSIEYKIKRVLGIYRLLIDGVDDIRLIEKCFKVIEKNKNYYKIKNFDFDIVNQIYSWTNFYIHAGIRPFPWITENAIDYLNSLFHVHKDKAKLSFSLYGGIEVKQEDLDEIRNNTKQNFRKLCGDKMKIIWIEKPEVRIIK